MTKNNLRTIGSAVGALLAFAVAGPVYSQAHTQPTQPANCYPSKFGPTDQIGNANYITPEKTLAATKLVTKGKAYRLGIETNSKTPAYPPRTFSVIIVSPGQTAGTTIGPKKLTYNDDI